jgi:hypothetical protein
VDNGVSDGDINRPVGRELTIVEEVVQLEGRIASSFARKVDQQVAVRSARPIVGQLVPSISPPRRRRGDFSNKQGWRVDMKMSHSPPGRSQDSQVGNVYISAATGTFQAKPLTRTQPPGRSSCCIA